MGLQPVKSCKVASGVASLPSMVYSSCPDARPGPPLGEGERGGPSEPAASVFPPEMWAPSSTLFRPLEMLVCFISGKL